ncbi:MAG: hypothetical protein JWQ40_4078 [Segetibacter sp.]|jgi:hypothetical protein|nr:hypothetical protein [Segetibacter sp.]
MTGKDKVIVILNTITLVLMLFFNYAFSTGLFYGVTVGEVSYKYDTLFTPSGYAFAIWSVIFLLCIGFVGYHWFLLKRGDPEFYIKRTGIWFIIGNLANALWLYCWTNEMIGWSVILILILLCSLCVLTVRLRLELDDVPVRTIFFVWWPIVFYLAWIMVATIACIAAWFVSNGWRGGAIAEDIWAITMIAAAGVLYLLLVRKRNLREAAAVGIWAFVAIAVRQWHTHNNIAITAIAAGAILLVVIVHHAYKRRHYLPHAKIKRGEWK